MQLPQSRIDVAAGSLLKAGELEVGDAIGRIDDFRLLDAGDFDTTTRQRSLSHGAARTANGDRHRRAFDATQHVGQGVGSPVSRSCLPIDGDQKIAGANTAGVSGRSEEHTSELQSRENLVCRLLLEKKKN